MAYSVIHSDEIDPAGPGGIVRFVHRGIGVEAFGINRFDLPPGAGGLEHDEARPSGGGRVRVRRRRPLAGRGEQVPVRAGSFIRFDAGTVRRPMAGADGLSFVAVGCVPGGYKPHGPF